MACITPMIGAVTWSYDKEVVVEEKHAGTDIELTGGYCGRKLRGRTAVRGIICQNGKYLVILGKQCDCKFPGGGMEQGEFLFGTLTREVLEETGCHVKPDSIREGFLVHEKTNRQSEEVLVMDSYYYFCEVEDIRDSKEAADASGYVVGNFHEGEAGTKVCWLPLADMIARNENVKEPSKAPWIVRELLVMRELQKNFL